MEHSAVQQIALLLVDDHAMFREGLARGLEKEPDLRVVGQSSSASAALAMLSSSGANMILLDVDLGAERALDFVIHAKRKGFEGQILVLTAGVSGPEAVQLVQAGVALTQYPPMLLRSTRYISPGLDISAMSCLPLGSVGSNTIPPEAMSWSLASRDAWL